jgi:hypothetical protein
VTADRILRFDGARGAFLGNLFGRVINWQLLCQISDRIATFTLGVRGATLERFGAIYLSSSNATLTRFKPDPLRDHENG